MTTHAPVPSFKSYKLLKDIDNPQFDRRSKYGHRQFERFKADTFFEGSPACLDDKRGFTAAFARCKDWATLQGDLAALIIGNSVEAEPSNWHEIATLDGGNHHWAEEVIETLLSDGVVNLEQVKTALKKCLSED
jgi:hypothetical protein